MSKLPRPFNRWTTYPGHGGIDYPQPRNTPVRASGPGVIDFSGYYSLRGGYAKFITYDCGCRHGYYHFDREQGLGRGARVDYGTVFAFVGSKGMFSTGPHLHHEVWNGHSSIIKPPAYWNYVDRDSYVGDGQPAGDEKPTPLPTPTPEEEEDDMAKTTGVYWTRKADGVTVFALTNPVSGYWSEWSGVDGGYNNAVAAGFDTGSFVKVTEGHAANLKASAAAVRA